MDDATKRKASQSTARPGPAQRNRGKWISVLMSLALGIVFVLASVRMEGGTWAAVMVNVGTALALASVLFYLEREWSRRTIDLEARTNARIDEVAHDLNTRMDQTLASTKTVEQTYVEGSAAEDEVIFTDFRGSPTPQRFYELVERADALGLSVLSQSFRYQTAFDPDRNAVSDDPRLGCITFGLELARSEIAVVVSQPVSGPGYPPQPRSVQVTWSGDMTVDDLYKELLENGLQGCGHLWFAVGGFASALTAATQTLGATIYEQIKTQNLGTVSVPPKGK